MSPEPRDSLLSVAQAAALLGVHPNTIRAWTDAGRLTAYRINSRGDRRFRRPDVERLLVEDARDGDGARSASDHVAALGLLVRVAGTLGADPSPESVAGTLVDGLRSDLGVERAAVYLADGTQLRLIAHAGFPTDPAPTRSLADLGDVPVASGADVTIPLRTHRGPSGVVRLDATSGARLEGPFGAGLASCVATALESSRLIVRAKTELRRARALRSVTKELTGTLDLGSLLGDVVELTRRLFDAERAGLWLVDERDRSFTVAAQHGLSERFLAQVGRLTTDAETLGTRALRDRRAYWVPNASEQGLGIMREVYAADGIQTACLVPLYGGDQALGLLGLYHLRDHAWPDEEVELLQAFADQAAVAIQNARLYRSLAMHAARMRSIQDLSARLNRLTDVKAIAEAIVAEASTLAEYHDIRIYRIDWERRMCDPIAFTRGMLVGDPADAERLLRVEVGEGFTGWVAEHAEPLLINDAVDDERGMTIEGTDDVPESMLVVPMLYEGRATGVIVLSQLGFNRFTADDLQTMSIFAGYAAQAMANASTYGQLVAQSSELRRRADTQRRLLETSGRLLGTLDQANVLETIADGLGEVVAYDNLSIYRADPIERVMVPVLTRELHAAEVAQYVIPYGSGLMGWAVEHGRPILANDALTDPRALQIPGTPDDPEAIAVVPLIADGEVLGALNVSRTGGPEVAFGDSDFELIQLFATQAAIALRNADAHHAVSQRAETDALTGLANHGAFQNELGRLIDRITESDDDGPRRLSVLMMDLDSFKAYNDRYGHPAGDALLHQAATAIAGASRSTDRVFRYGGDEFALILPSTTVSEAARIGERIRAAVAQLTMSDAAPVTITVGVAGLPGDADDRASLIEAADTALYYGKRSGEDRVVRADQLPSDVVDLRGTLDELARAALIDGDDPHAVEHLVERASQLSDALHHDDDAIGQAALAVSRALMAPDGGTADGDAGHADRVGRLASLIAGRLGMPHDEQQWLELAGRLHGLDDRALAELSTLPSLRPVAELVAGHRRLKADGARRGQRGPRARGPVGPHAVTAAEAYDLLVSAPGAERLGRADAMTRLREHPATFRSDVIAALAAVVDHRADPGRRRRAEDHEEERGAA